MITIKEAIKEIFDDNADGVTFLPTDEEDLNIKGFNFTKRSKYEKHTLGYVYHILLFKNNFKENKLDSDNFTAILTDPYVYVSSIIDCGFYGVVVKKTKQSSKIINEIYKSMSSQFSYA